jgi:hypothetical protein
MWLMIADAFSLILAPHLLAGKILYRSEQCKVPAKAIIGMNKFESQ